MRNQKEFSLLNNDQKATLSGLGTNLAGPIQQAAAFFIAFVFFIYKNVR